MMPGLVGMNAVGTHELPISCNTLQKSGDQRGAVGLCQSGKNRLKALGVIGSKIGRQAHTYNDQLGSRCADPHSVDDPLQIALRLRQGDPVQAIVAAQFQQKDIYGLLQHPVDSTQPAGGCLSWQSCVYNPERETSRISNCLDSGGKALCFSHAVPCGEAVTEEQNNGWLRFLRGNSDCRKDESSNAQAHALV